MMKNAWWVVVGEDGNMLSGDGISSNLSVFDSKEKAVEYADESFETETYRIRPVQLEFLDEPRKKSRKRTRH